jgi:hypothetical protein
LGLNPLEFGVDGGERDLDLLQRGPVGGIDLGTDVADDQGHQVDQAGEEQFPRLLIDLGVIEQFVELVGVEGAFHEDARHDGDRAVLDEALEDLAEQHDRDPEEWNVTPTVPGSYCGGHGEGTVEGLKSPRRQGPQKR